jgi:hypothetical protein
MCRSWTVSASRRPMSVAVLVARPGWAGSQMSKRTGSVRLSHCWNAAVVESAFSQGREKCVWAA